MSRPHNILDYQSPSNVKVSLNRKWAVRFARANGLFSLLVWALTGEFPTARVAWVALPLANSYSLMFCCFGILYIIAGYTIRNRNRLWETILIITALCQLGAIALVFAIGILHIIRLDGVSLVVLVCAVVLLAGMIQFTAKARREG